MSLLRWIVIPALMLPLMACRQPQAADSDGLTETTLMLDWVPNVNHTGLYVAQRLGYFEQAGLDVSIIQPGEVLAEQAVASGAAQFGLSFQEQVTLARADGVPLVSLAAVIQENTSGFAALSSAGVESPADWEGLRYGAFGSPFEAPTLQALMTCAGGDFSALTVTETGFADPLALLQAGQIDLAWIFYGTQGIAAEQQGIDLKVLMMQGYRDCIPNYYTPVIITSQQMIDDNPEVVRALMGAASRGYAYAITNPEEAADILGEVTPEAGPELLRASQAWLSPRYQGDAARWGEQSAETWQAYADWMTQNGILAEPLDMSAAFTNEFLPE